MSILSCDNLGFAYEGKIIVKDINFSLEENDYLSVIGENGAGKSTLIKGILSLIKPSLGKITFSDNISKKEIGYLPQISYLKKDFPASVYEVVLSGTLNKIGFFPFYSKKEKDIANKNIKLLDIEKIKHKCFRELSGGQMQRVLLARALSATKKILVLDEPTTGLDYSATVSFYDIIKKLNRKHSITIIMISHDIKKAIEESNKILLIKNHRQAFFGTTNDYLDSSFYKNALKGGDIL